MTQYVSDISQRPLSVKFRIEKQHSEQLMWLIEPQLVVYPDQKPKRKRHFIFILDVSVSMAVDHRLDYARTAVQDFIEKLSPQDLFSIIVFNHEAVCLIESKTATQSHLEKAQARMQDLLADGVANYFAAFERVKRSRLVKASQDATIIFLTDGNDHHVCAPTDLVRTMTAHTAIPRIIPIGIDLMEAAPAYTLLSGLARLANNGAIDAIFIQEMQQQAYSKALDQVYDLISEHSKTPVHVQIKIEAKHPINSTSFVYQRELHSLRCDGRTVHGGEFYFQSFSPPTSCEVQFTCDQISLSATRRFDEAALGGIEDNAPIIVSANKVQFKNFRLAHRIKSLASIVLGLGLMAVGATFLIMGMPVWDGIAGIAVSAAGAALGLGLFVRGVMTSKWKAVLSPEVAASVRDQERDREEKVESLSRELRARHRSSQGLVQQRIEFVRSPQRSAQVSELPSASPSLPASAPRSGQHTPRQRIPIILPPLSPPLLAVPSPERSRPAKGKRTAASSRRASVDGVFSARSKRAASPQFEIAMAVLPVEQSMQPSAPTRRGSVYAVVRPEGQVPSSLPPSYPHSRRASIPPSRK